MDERREERRPTDGAVRITVQHTELRCIIHNLSPSGCMLECAGIEADIGSPVDVTLLPGYTVRGEIAWMLGDSVGIFFIEPVKAHIVQRFALDDWMLRGDWAMQRVTVPR